MDSMVDMAAFYADLDDDLCLTEVDNDTGDYGNIQLDEHDTVTEDFLKQWNVGSIPNEAGSLDASQLTCIPGTSQTTFEPDDTEVSAASHPPTACSLKPEPDFVASPEPDTSQLPSAALVVVKPALLPELRKRRESLPAVPDFTKLVKLPSISINLPRVPNVATRLESVTPAIVPKVRPAFASKLKELGLKNRQPINLARKSCPATLAPVIPKETGLPNSFNKYHRKLEILLTHPALIALNTFLKDLDVSNAASSSIQALNRKVLDEVADRRSHNAMFEKQSKQVVSKSFRVISDIADLRDSVLLIRDLITEDECFEKIESTKSWLKEMGRRCA